MERGGDNVHQSKAMSELTYLMFDGYHYKIGKSINPEVRLKNFQTGNPRIKLVAYGKAINENELHKRFQKQNIGGEWFFFDEYHIQIILYLLKPIFFDKEYLKNINKKQFSLSHNHSLLISQWETINKLHTDLINWQDAYRKKSNKLRNLEIEFKQLKQKKFSIKEFIKHIF